MWRKISKGLYEHGETGYYAEQIRDRWDAYLPVASDMRLHIWESLAHRTRRDAGAAIATEIRRVNCDLRRAIEASRSHRAHSE